MAGNHPSINLKSILAELDNELDDLYNEGVISASIYNKKAQQRMLVNAISQADRHIALQMKLAAHVAVYVPADQRTVFFSRQSEFVDQWMDEHSEMKAADARQYALLLDDKSFLQIVSVISTYAYAFGELPVSAAPSADDRLRNRLASEVEDKREYTYATTTGTVKVEKPSGKSFYADADRRKMVLSESFGSPTWLRFEAQIAPVGVPITDLSKSELECYKIRSPYYTREWLINRSMVQLLSNRAASEGGYFDTEQKSKAEAFDNKPGTGNVIISGDELDGNYESDFTF